MSLEVERCLAMGVAWVAWGGGLANRCAVAAVAVLGGKEIRRRGALPQHEALVEEADQPGEMAHTTPTETISRRRMGVSAF